jgi:hypothetical protein
LAKRHFFNVDTSFLLAIFAKIFGHEVGFWPQKSSISALLAKRPKNGLEKSGQKWV